MNHNSVQRDSVFVLKYDSIIVRMSGDTVFVDRFHTDFKDRILTKTDTLIEYQERINNSNMVSEKQVAKPLTKWEKFIDLLGWILLVALIVFMIVMFVRLWRWK